MAERDDSLPSNPDWQSDTTGDQPALADVDLVAGYLAGQRAAFHTVDGWIRAVLRRSYTRLREDHDDLCQIAHGQLVTALREGRFGGLSSLRSYVSAIAHHRGLDRVRERWRDRALVALDEDPLDRNNPYRDIEMRDELQEAHRVIAALPASCRELWRLIFVERLDYTEVGERLSIPVGTVKSRMWHCRRRAAGALRRIRLTKRSRSL